MIPESVAVPGRHRCKNTYGLLKGEFARLCRPELITAILPGRQRAKSSSCVWVKKPSHVCLPCPAFAVLAPRAQSLLR